MPVSSCSASALQASTPPTKRAPAAVQADSKRDCLLFVQHGHGDDVGLRRYRRVTEWQREGGHAALVAFGELLPRPHPWGIQRQCVGVLPLADAEVVVAARLGQCDGLITAHQREVHHVELDQRGADDHRVDVDVIDARVEREVVLTLNDAEPEAVPLQRIGRAHQEFARLLQRQLAVLGSGRTRCRGASDMVRRTMVRRRCSRTDCGTCRAAADAR